MTCLACSILPFKMLGSFSCKNKHNLNLLIFFPVAFSSYSFRTLSLDTQQCLDFWYRFIFKCFPKVLLITAMLSGGRVYRGGAGGGTCNTGAWQRGQVMYVRELRPSRGHSNPGPFLSFVFHCFLVSRRASLFQCACHILSAMLFSHTSPKSVKSTNH